MATLQVHVFKDSAASFTAALSENGIEFSRRIQLSEAPMAAGAIIEIFSAIKDATPWGALAVVVIAWLNAKAARKVIITTKNNEIIHAEGLSVSEIERVLEKAKDVAIIELPNKDKP
jgi:hypothetical protein